MRLAIGIVLVLASVAGVWFIVHAARVTEPALAASRPLVPGQTVTAADVVELEVRLGEAADGYLTPADLEGGLVVTRVIDSGELLARGAVDEADVVDATTVVVRSALDVPEVVERGSTVELWAAPLVAPGEHGEPESIVASATVAEIRTEEGVVSQAGAALELVVARDAVAVVLEHVAGGSALSAVPVAVPREPAPAPEQAGAGDEATPSPAPAEDAE